MDTLRISPQEPSNPFNDVAGSSDRFVYWPLFVVLCVALTLMLFGGWPTTILPALLGPVPILLVVILMAFIRFIFAVWNRRWRRAASLAVVPMCVLSIVFAPKAVDGSHRNGYTVVRVATRMVGTGVPPKAIGQVGASRTLCLA
jgi:uncharacterized membrane protein